MGSRTIKYQLENCPPDNRHWTFANRTIFKWDKCQLNNRNLAQLSPGTTINQVFTLPLQQNCWTIFCLVKLR